MTGTLLALACVLLVACNNVKSQLTGTWTNTDDGDTHTIVLNSDNTAVVDAGAGTTKGKWSVKDGYLYIDREDSNYADLKAQIPSGQFKSLVVEEDETSNDSGDWTTETYTKQ
ncbi:MAG: hypothetical protein SPD91_01125 [Streptococcus hyointestinalis]|nr:hypothetical protein [Streptococcus hyointestinalis]